MESWDGSAALPRSEIVARYPTFAVDFPEVWWPEAENEGDLYARAARAHKDIRSLGEDTDRQVAAVSHGTFGAVLISSFLGAPPSGYTRFSQHNCCVSVLDIRPGRAKLYRGNDTSHLPDELLT
jgi:broad specificity phosphatase PhoE